MVVVLRVLRMSVGAGMPLAVAAHVAADVDVNWNLRGRVLKFAALLSSGTPAAEAAQTAGLGRVVGLAVARPDHGLDPGLRYAADYYDALTSRWWALLSALMLPLCTLALGIVTGAAVYVMFRPLVILLDSVM